MSSTELGARILVVDDDHDTAELLADLLTRRGWVSEHVGTGQEALDAAAAHQPRFALIDLRLPDFSGIEVGRVLRERSPPEALALAAFTGSMCTTDIDDALAAGFDFFITKPIAFDMLHTLVAAALEPDGHALARAMRRIRR